MADIKTGNNVGPGALRQQGPTTIKQQQKVSLQTNEKLLAGLRMQSPEDVSKGKKLGLPPPDRAFVDADNDKAVNVADLISSMTSPDGGGGGGPQALLYQANTLMGAALRQCGVADLGEVQTSETILSAIGLSGAELNPEQREATRREVARVEAAAQRLQRADNDQNATICASMRQQADSHLVGKEGFVEDLKRTLGMDPNVSNQDNNIASCNAISMLMNGKTNADSLPRLLLGFSKLLANSRLGADISAEVRTADAGLRMQQAKNIIQGSPTGGPAKPGTGGVGGAGGPLF